MTLVVVLLVVTCARVESQQARAVLEPVEGSHLSYWDPENAYNPTEVTKRRICLTEGQYVLAAYPRTLNAHGRIVRLDGVAPLFLAVPNIFSGVTSNEPDWEYFRVRRSGCFEVELFGGGQVRLYRIRLQVDW